MRVVVHHYAHADKLDSVMVLAEADGDMAESYRYKEYGEPTVVDASFAKLTTLNSNVGNWKRFTGQEHAMPASVADPWQFYRARAYRADAGRFVQRDSFGYRAGQNLYLYVNNSPLVLIDPTGHFPGPSPFDVYTAAMMACCLAGSAFCCRALAGNGGGVAEPIDPMEPKEPPHVPPPDFPIPPIEPPRDPPVDDDEWQECYDDCYMQIFGPCGSAMAAMIVMCAQLTVMATPVWPWMEPMHGTGIGTVESAEAMCNGLYTVMGECCGNHCDETVGG